jgi:hypothetical protein
MDTPSSGETAADAVLRLAAHVKIVHHCPGRVRLKLLADASTLSGLLRDGTLEGLIRSIPGLLSMRINGLARSIVLHYDETTLPPDLFAALGQLRDTPALAQELRQRLSALFNGS